MNLFNYLVLLLVVTGPVALLRLVWKDVRRRQWERHWEKRLGGHDGR